MQKNVSFLVRWKANGSKGFRASCIYIHGRRVKPQERLVEVPIELTQKDAKKHTFFSMLGKVLKKPLHFD